MVVPAQIPGQITEAVVAVARLLLEPTALDQRAVTAAQELHRLFLGVLSLTLVVAVAVLK